MATLKRKAFISLEFLLILGLIVGAIAGVFKLYQNVQKNQDGMTLTQDITAIVSGLDRYKAATGGYPFSVSELGFAVSDNGWNDGYIPNDIGSKWKYATATTTAVDADTGTAIGYWYISTEQAKYSGLKVSEITNILKGKCLNGNKAIALENITIPAVTNDKSQCLLGINTVIYKHY